MNLYLLTYASGVKEYVASKDITTVALNYPTVRSIEFIDRIRVLGTQN